jgi:hypothetical protein
MSASETEIHPSHPYWELSKPECREVRAGLWRVTWRDFYTEKHDAEFASFFAANQFIQNMTRRQRAGIHDDASTEDFISGNRFWTEIAKPFADEDSQPVASV